MFKTVIKVLAGSVTLALALSVLPSLAVEPDQEPQETVFTIMETQVGAPWGLDRIDGTSDGSYTYLSSGAGVRIYIVDTGVDATHKEFGSRVADGFDAFGQNLDQTDCHGHGTHVAGLAAGAYYGAAKASTIVPVRVLDCYGRGNTQSLIDGINWILSTHPGGPAIVNMSLGGSRDESVNSAASRLIAEGMTVIAAAGNSNVDACTFSPASAPGVIAVGATDKSDVRASFSNWGACVDVFAPGVLINSANSLDHNISSRRSGTSQAAPFVAGAVATYMSRGVVSSPDSVESYLYDISEPDVVVGGDSARNNLVNVEKETLPEPEPAPEPEPEPAPSIEPSPEPIVEPEPVLPEPEPSDPPVIDEPILPEPEVTEPEPEVTEPEPVEPIDYNIQAYQSEPGARTGWLKWDLIEGATYKIYKSSSIRPQLRQFALVKEGINRFLLSDVHGSLSVYKIVAVIDSEELEMGEIKYTPRK